MCEDRTDACCAVTLLQKVFETNQPLCGRFLRGFEKLQLHTERSSSAAHVGVKLCYGDVCALLVSPVLFSFTAVD